MNVLRKLTALLLCVLLAVPTLALPAAAEGIDDYVIARFQYTALGSGVEKGVGSGTNQQYYLAEPLDLTPFGVSESNKVITAPDVYLQMDVNATYNGANGIVFLQPHSGSSLVNTSASPAEKTAMDKSAGKWYTVTAPLAMTYGGGNDGIDVTDIRWMTFFIPAADSIQMKNLRIVKMTAAEIRTELQALVDAGLPAGARYATLNDYNAALADANTVLANANTSGPDLMTAWSRLRCEKEALVDLSAFDTTYYAMTSPYNGGVDVVDYSGTVAWRDVIYPAAPGTNTLADHADPANLRIEVDVLFDEDPGADFAQFFFQTQGAAFTNVNVADKFNAVRTQPGVWHTISYPLSSVTSSPQDVTGLRFHMNSADQSAVYQIHFKGMRIVDGYDDAIRAELKAAAEQRPSGEFTADTLEAYHAAQAAGLATLEDTTADYITYTAAIEDIAAAKAALVDTAYLVGIIPAVSGGDYDSVATWNMTGGAWGSPVLSEPLDLSAHKKENLRYRVDLRAVSNGDKVNMIITQPRMNTLSNFRNEVYYNQGSVLADGEWHTYERNFVGSYTDAPDTWHQINCGYFFISLSETANVTLEIRRLRVVDITNEKSAADLQALIATDLGDTTVYPAALTDNYTAAKTAAQEALTDGTAEAITLAYFDLESTIHAFGSRVDLVAAINAGLDQSKTYSAASLAAYNEAITAAQAVLADASADDDAVADAVAGIAAAKAALVNITYLVAQYPPAAGADENGVTTWAISGPLDFGGSALPQSIDMSDHSPSKLRFRVDFKLVDGDASQLGSLTLQPRDIDNQLNNVWDASPKNVLGDGEWHTFERDFTSQMQFENWAKLNRYTFHFQTNAPVTLQIKNARVVDITAEEALGTVTTAGIGTVDITGGIESGTTDTLVAYPAAAYTLAGWTVNGKWTTDETVNLPADGKQDVKAYFVGGNEIAAVFLGKYNETVAVKKATSAAELAALLENTTATALGGYQFVGWTESAQSADQLYNTAVAGNGIVTVTAVYEQEPAAKGYHLTVGAGVTAKDGLNNAVDGSTDLGFDQRITVTAEGDVAYWVLDGAKVGFGKNSYTFYVSGDNAIAAILTADAEPIAPTVVLQQATYAQGSETFTLTVIAQTSIPAGSTVSEYGVIFTSKVPTAAFLNDPASAVVKVKSSKTGANQQYMAHLLNVKTDRTRYARAYAIVDGVTIYSATAVQFKTAASGVTTDVRAVA
ncbi:MAG: InlB B-repeat-containing protein [Acutalibacteraceae bacterium]|jgi:hypothetical protein